jgi:GT2 family glycosyltransferase
MNATPAVTVVIPVFERQAVLAAALRYFSYQDYPRESFEVIVVDDGSPERIGAAVGRLHLPYEMKVIVQANRGRAAARNTGVHHARGDLIVFCDADRIPDASFISNHVRFHERQLRAAGVGIPWDCFLAFDKIAAGSADLLPLMLRFARRPPYYDLFCRLLATEECYSALGWAGFLVGNSSVRKSHLLAVGGFDEDLTTWGIEHFELALRLTQRAALSIRYLHGASSYHIPHARSPEYFRAGIETAVKSLADRPHAPTLDLLRKFLLGDLSLQEFSRAYSGNIDERIASEAPLYFHQLG